MIFDFSQKIKFGSIINPLPPVPKYGSNTIYLTVVDNDQNIGRFIKEKPRVWTITSFSDSGVRLKFVGVTQPGKQWEVRTQVIREIKIAFDDEGIKIPYNQIRVIN